LLAAQRWLLQFTRVRADWAFSIPDALPSVQAAPLLCAGVTTWTPFVHNKVKKGDKV
jgi:D-arabinose 1-dehydrogenase-like Zn-dependent alcohol dehydrogenase